MTFLSKRAQEVFGRYSSEQNPASGLREWNRLDVQQWAIEMEGLLLGTGVSETIAFLGDSHMAFGSGFISTAATLNSRGPLTWAMILSGGRVIMPSTHNFGVGGETTAQMLARVGDITGLVPRPGICVVMGGTNDIAAGGISTNTIMANLVDIWDALLEAGIAVIASPPPPIGSGTYSASEIGQVLEIKEAMLDYIGTRERFYVADHTAETFDDALADARSGVLLPDDVHLKQYGAFLIGRSWARGIIKLARNPAPLPTVNGQTWSAANPGGNLVANGLMDGDGGSGTGDIADDWSLDTTNVGGATVTATKTADYEGYEQQRVVISGQYSSDDNDFPKVSFAYTLDTNDFDAGDVIEGLIKAEIATGMTNIHAVALRLDAAWSGGSYTSYCNINDSAMNFYSGPAERWTGVLRVPRFALGGAPSSLLLSVDMMFKVPQAGFSPALTITNAGIALDGKFSRAAVYKVIP